MLLQGSHLVNQGDLTSMPEEVRKNLGDFQRTSGYLIDTFPFSVCPHSFLKQMSTSMIVESKQQDRNDNIEYETYRSNFSNMRPPYVSVKVLLLM
jgi:hypothetical protein